MSDDGETTRPTAILPRRRAALVVFWGFAAVAAYFLWVEHRAHVNQVLPWLFFLLCPLMHLFMHRHHGESPASNAHDERGAG